MLFTAADIAKQLEGDVVGDPLTPITGFAPADNAKAGDLTFAENEDYFARAEKSAASAILVNGSFSSSGKVLIRVPNARVGFARVMNLFFPAPKILPGVHATAVVSPSAQVDPSACVGPHCVIGDRVRIGARTVLQACDCVEADCQIGDDAHLLPNVTLYSRSQVGHRVRIHAGSVIGSDGFGYVLDKGAHLKIPQIGNVIIHDDVEIGANVTIDRAALGSTVIGKGTKIDNLVQIGHNVIIGEHSIIISQVGIAGSTKLGNNVTLAGQVGLAGHLTIGNNVKIYAQSGVMNDIPDDENWLGTPAQPDKRMKRTYLALMRLPELLRKVGALEKRLDALPPGK